MRVTGAPTGRELTCTYIHTLHTFIACSAAEVGVGGTGFKGRVLILSFIDGLGWGNRMPSIITAAVMALLTNRALYLE